ncbi:MAG: hypothetical protein K2K68_08645 [Duncaniella sp.]|nr:hypothetical protein [Duncaniella sp.]
MKLFKYISILAVGAVAFTSCSDDNDDFSINTAPGVGVSVESSEMVVNEMKGIFKVPLVLTGEPNGYVRATVKIIGTDDPSQDQAIADNNFYVTSQTINIPADEKTASVEIRTQYLETRDPDLYFKVVIEEAQGATIQPLNSCTIAIVDRFSSPVYSLSGPWEIHFTSYWGEEFTTTKTNLDVINEETGQCQFLDFCPEVSSDMNLPVILRPGDEGRPYNMFIPLGSVFIQGANFGGELGICDVTLIDMSGKQRGEYSGQWNSDYTEITFNDDFVLGIMKDGSWTGRVYQIFTRMTLKPLL